MKNDLCVLPSVNRLFEHIDDVSPDLTLLSVYCSDLMNAHMSLGVCVAHDCDDFDTVERVRNVMNTIAEVYESFHEIVEELSSYELNHTL